MIYSGEQPPARFNLARCCLAEKPAEKTALIVAGPRTERWSYGALEDVVLRLAGGLRRSGVEPGERMFIRMGNSLDFALLFFAANVIGALPIPASPMLAPVEVTKLLHLSGSRFVAWDGVLALPGLEDVNLLSPDEIARLKRSPATSYADTAADDPA